MCISGRGIHRERISKRLHLPHNDFFAFDMSHRDGLSRSFAQWQDWMSLGQT